MFTAGNDWAAASSTILFREIPTAEAMKSLSQPSGQSPLRPHGAAVGLISVALSAMRSQGEQQIWFDRQTGAALQSRRLGYGRDSRLKTHRFVQTGVWRERRSPDEDAAAAPPEAWPLRSAALLPYPAEVGRSPVITPLMLLSRASELALRVQPGKLDYPVLGDNRIHRVVLESREETLLDVDVDVRTGDRTQHISGKRAVRDVDIRPHLLGATGENEAFSLLELEGETTLSIDRATGLPVRIRGEWLRVGEVAVTLTRATLRDGCHP